MVIADLDAEERAGTVELVESNGGMAHSLYLDLHDPESIEAAVASATEAAGSLEILVYNAGIAGPTAPCDEIII